MKKVWPIAAHEIRRNVYKRSFLLSLFGVPFIIALSLSLGLILESFRQRAGIIGIVDLSGLLADAALPAEIRSRVEAGYDAPVSFTLYAGEDAALADLTSGNLEAYFLLPEDYRQTGWVEVVFTKEPASTVWRQFRDLLQAALLASEPPDTAARLVTGSEFVVRSFDGLREVATASGPTFDLLMPLFIAFAFLFLLILGSGYMMNALADEKENRTIEVLLTSVSPTQLAAGKILGVAAVSFLLLVFWTATTWIGVTAARWAGIGWFGDLGMDWVSVLSCIAVAVPSFVVAAALMTAVGAMIPSAQEGQPIGMIFFFLHMLPVYLALPLMREPQGPVSVLLSLLPFTALMSVGVRNLFTVVPAWQVAAAVLLQAGAAIGAIWLAGRAIRLGLLQYDRRLPFRRLFLRRTGE
jgi:ABC-2 type transport system permease protein